MKSLRTGETIMNSYLIHCKYGKSNLVLTNFQIMIENFNGLVLSLEYSEISDLQLIDLKLVRISWMEGENLYHLSIKSDMASKIIHDYAIAKQTYEEKYASF
jgi:hypothetical protein